MKFIANSIAAFSPKDQTSADETVIADSRSRLSPSQCVERKVFSMLQVTLSQTAVRPLNGGLAIGRLRPMQR